MKVNKVQQKKIQKFEFGSESAVMLLEEEGKYEVTLIAEDTFEEESKKRGELKVSFVIDR